jgi:hypothetical protein
VGRERWLSRKNRVARRSIFGVKGSDFRVKASYFDVKASDFGVKAFIFDVHTSDFGTARKTAFRGPSTTPESLK